MLDNNSKCFGISVALLQEKYRISPNTFCSPASCRFSLSGEKDVRGADDL